MAETPPEAPETTTAKLSESRRMWLAVVIWITFIGFITFVSIRPVQLPGDTLGIIIGSLTTFVGLVVSYYFSTSMGSSTKSVLMGRMGMQPTTPTVTVTPAPDATTTTTTTTEPPKP